MTPGAPSKVLDVGAMHLKTDEVAFAVGDHGTRAALDLLARVEATRSAAFAGSHRLNVDRAGRRARLAARLLARRHDPGMIDPRPGPVMRPSVEILLYGRTGRTPLRQLPPLAPGRRHGEDLLTTARRSVCRGRPIRFGSGINR